PLQRRVRPSLQVRQFATPGRAMKERLPGHAVDADGTRLTVGPPDDPNKRQTAPQCGRVSDRTMVDTVLVIAGQLAIVSDRITGRTTMSQRKTTVPPTRKPSRSSRSGREGLIAKDKDRKAISKEEVRP